MQECFALYQKKTSKKLFRQKLLRSNGFFSWCSYQEKVLPERGNPFAGNSKIQKNLTLTFGALSTNELNKRHSFAAWLAYNEKAVVDVKYR